MKSFLAAVAVFVVMIAVAFWISEGRAALRVLDERTALAATRSCLYPIGGWTIINCSNAAAAQSAALTANARYVIQCGDDSYFAMGDEATDEADANDGWIPAGAWVDFYTSATVLYASCKNKNIDSDCRVIECQ